MNASPQDPSNTRCAACGQPLEGWYTRDMWGNATCSRHEAEFPRCSACTRLICPRLTGGGVTYADGRQVCMLCRRTAIDSKEQARPYVNAVAAWLYERGFRFSDLKLRIDLVSRGDFGPAKNGPGAVQGQFRGVIDGRGHRAVEGINVLYGLPRRLMQGVFAHELGHAWLFLERIDGLAPPIEEGFCQVMAYLFHRDSGSQEGRVYMRMIEEDQNRVYGEGFRNLREAVGHHSFVYVLDYIRQNKALPV